MTKKKGKEKKKPRPVKVNLEANMPRPGPISLAGPRHVIEKARDFPLLGCWVMQGWRERGITPVIVARQQEKERVLYGVYLVDIFCLGVKNAYARTDISRKRFDQDLSRMLHEAPQEISPALAHEIIYGAIGFARRYDFEPHPDYKLASILLEPEGTYPPTHEVEFGKDGKPLFISGPHDNVEAVLAKLHRTAGEGNYDFIAMLGDPYME